MKPGYLALYSHKYKAENSVSYFCINLKPLRSFRVFVPLYCALYDFNDHNAIQPHPIVSPLLLKVEILVSGVRGGILKE